MESKPKKTGQWDTFYSTFYWKIFLDTAHAFNEVPELTGYSGRVGEMEAQDKVQMLKRKIANLYNHGYFSRSLRIEIFMRSSELIDKRRDPCILQLYPKYYNIPEADHDYVFKNYGVWLKDFYHRVVNGLSMDGIIPDYRSQYKRDNYLNPEVYNFTGKTPGHLYSHASRAQVYGFPPGQISDFISKVKRLNNWL